MQITTTIHALEQAGLSYTVRQLYYAVCRAYLPAPIRAALARLRWARFTLPTPLDNKRFERHLADWMARHGHPPGLLHEAALAPAVPLHGREPDLALYTLPRVLICQSQAIAAMLRANAATMEFGCPVLAADDPLPAPIAVGLARAPMPQVLLLHDAGPAGFDLGATLAAQLPVNVQFSSIGLRPDHAARLHLFVQRNQPRASKRTVPQDLTGAERRWLLAGWTVEVAAVPPLILLRALRQATGNAPIEPSLRERLRRLPASGFMSWPA